MKLIEFKDNQLNISDEAYHIKCFRNLYDDLKEVAIDLFGYLYFMYHPGSDYNYITTEDEKQTTILEALGIEDLTLLTNSFFTECISVYKKMVITTSSRTLEGNRKKLDKLDNFLDNLVLDDDNMTKYTRAISDLTKLSVEIAQAEKEIHKDVEEQSSKVRGKTELKIGDKGLNNL